MITKLIAWLKGIFDMFFRAPGGNQHSWTPGVRVYTEFAESISNPIVGLPFTLNVSGGVPNTGLSWVLNVHPAGTSAALNGTATLDSLGGIVFTPLIADVPGYFEYVITFAATGHVVTVGLTVEVPNYTFVGGIPYGGDTLQFANVYIPTGTIKGTVMRVHGGGWSSGNLGDLGPSPTAASIDMAHVANNGYMVVDCNYRGVNTGGGSNGNGQFPNNVNDVVTALSYCLVSGLGAGSHAMWETIHTSVVNNGGLMITGTSAGGHLVVMGTGQYGVISGNWPKACVSMAGPMNVNYNRIFIEPMVQAAVINGYVTPAQFDNASPQYLFRTAADTPGSWFGPVTGSPCKWKFIHNLNDSLVTNAMAKTAIEQWAQYNGPNVTVQFYEQGPPTQAFQGVEAIVEKGSTPDGTVATLPSTGNKLGDMYIANGGMWVYNYGQYPGDPFNHASEKGFTWWFNHNFEIREGNAIVTEANAVFGY